MAKVHIGKKIKEVLKDSGIKSKDFALSINTSRTNIYDIFRRDTIDSELLKKISKALNYNFFDHYDNELPMVKQEGKAGYVKKDDLITSMGKDMQAMKRKMAEMEEKYEMLQKLSRFQEEKIKRLEKKDKK